MENFSSAWPNVDHAPIFSDTADRGFEYQNARRDSASGLQDAEWNGLIKTVEDEHYDHSTAHFDLDWSNFPLTSDAPYEPATVAEAPLISPWASSSATSTTISPPVSATQPFLSFIAPVKSHPQSVFQTGGWRPEADFEPSHFRDFGQGGLGINFSNAVPDFGWRAGVPETQLCQPPPYVYLDDMRPEDDHFENNNHQQSSSQDGAVDIEDDDGEDSTDPCYAKLLWTCLKGTPGHTLSLKELYEWVARNSQKAKDPKTRGWQNSVRHNLSMNAAFERVQSCNGHGTKKGSLWRLTDEALRAGVISTTRYRKDPKRRSDRRGHPAPKRQLSGKKGGQATRAATRRQRELQHARSMPYLALADHHHRLQSGQYNGALMSPYSPQPTCQSPQLLMTPSSPTSPYHFDVDRDGIMPPLPACVNSQALMGFDGQVKPALGDFDFRHFDLMNGLPFRDYDSALPDTPSMRTEASFATDECALPVLSRDISREATIF